jgi:hypothetical protein
MTILSSAEVLSSSSGQHDSPAHSDYDEKPSMVYVDRENQITQAEPSYDDHDVYVEMFLPSVPLAQSWLV